MAFDIYPLGREELVPALFSVLLEAIEVVPRIEVEEEFLLGTLGAELSLLVKDVRGYVRTTGWPD